MVPSTIAQGRNREDQGESERYHLIRKEKHISQRPVWGKKKKTFSFLICQSREEVKKKREAGKRQVGTRGTHVSV